nr:hypothetical protein [uncultured Flavobacterium sp.]
MSRFLYTIASTLKNRYFLILMFMLLCSKNYSQEKFILRYAGPSICIGTDCTILLSYYYLSYGISINPIYESGNYFVFDKFPTYIELVSVAETGFNCDWRSPSTCGDHITLKPSDCNWVISNKVLNEPTATTNSFCDKVMLAAVGCTGTQKFYWEYSTDGANFTATNVSTNFNESYEFKKDNFPALNNYNGNIFFRVLIDWDPSTTDDNIYSNIVTYKIDSCSPPLDGDPVTSDVKCANQSSGSVLIKLKETISSNQKLLLNLFEGTTFRSSKFVASSDIINKQFIWNDISAGIYTIKYQAQTINDNSDRVGNFPILTPAFTIKNIKPLTFKLTLLPLCSDSTLAIKVEADGGTPPYYYILDQESEIVNGIAVEKKHQFNSPFNIQIGAEGNHTVKVTDLNNCIENKI